MPDTADTIAAAICLAAGRIAHGSQDVETTRRTLAADLRPLIPAPVLCPHGNACLAPLCPNSHPTTKPPVTEPDNIAQEQDRLGRRSPEWYAGYQAAMDDACEVDARRPAAELEETHQLSTEEARGPVSPAVVAPTTLSALLRDLAELADDMATPDHAADTIRRARAWIVDGIENGEA
jgi:hypothetical protein